MGPVLIPRTLGNGSTAAGLVMATVAVNEALGYRILANEVRQKALELTLLYLGALAVPHRNAPGKATREMKNLAELLAAVQDSSAEGRAKTAKTSETVHSAYILTKPLQGGGFFYKHPTLLRKAVQETPSPSD